MNRVKKSLWFASLLVSSLLFLETANAKNSQASHPAYGPKTPIYAGQLARNTDSWLKYPFQKFIQCYTTNSYKICKIPRKGETIKPMDVTQIYSFPPGSQLYTLYPGKYITMSPTGKIGSIIEIHKFGEKLKPVNYN